MSKRRPYSKPTRKAEKPRWQPSQKPKVQKQLQLDGGEDPGPLFGPLPIKKPGKGRLRSKTYRKKLRQATPPWADMAAIRKFYREAKLLTRVTGHQHSVDHVIPLKGEYVCGLHVHNNLEVTLHEVNMRKGNTFCEQMELFE